MAEKTKKFYSPDGTDIRVTHPDGSVALIGETARKLPKKLWKAAIKEGALATDSQVTKHDLSGLNDGDDAEQRRQSIYDLMLEAWEADEDPENKDPKYDEAFTGAGKPNVRWLEKQLQFDIDGKERDEIWEQVQAENGSEDDDAEGGDSN